MKPAAIAALSFALAVPLAACGHRDTGGVTQEESDQLNNAAEMLDSSPDRLVTGNAMVPDNELVNVDDDESGAANAGAAQ